MMEKDQQLIWKYLDNACSEEEMNFINDQIDRDDLFRKELKQAEKLHGLLGDVEPHQPSMRFVKNLMEQIPEMPKKLVINPLVPKSLIRNFVLGTFLVILGLFVITWEPATKTNLPSNYSIELPRLTYIEELATTYFSAISLETWAIISALTTSLLLFVVIDRWVASNNRLVQRDH